MLLDESLIVKPEIEMMRCRIACTCCIEVIGGCKNQGVPRVKCNTLLLYNIKHETG